MCVFILTTLMSYGQIIGGSAKVGAGNCVFSDEKESSFCGLNLSGGLGLEYAISRRFFLEPSLQFEYKIFRAEERNNQILKSVVLPIALGYRFEAFPKTNVVFKCAYWGKYWLTSKKEVAGLLKESPDEFVGINRFTHGISVIIGYEKRAYFLEMGMSLGRPSLLDRKEEDFKKGYLFERKILHVNIGRNF